MLGRGRLTMKGVGSWEKSVMSGSHSGQVDGPVIALAGRVRP